MIKALETAPILMADDDDGDRLLTYRALEKNQVPNLLVTVMNGEELLDYLRRTGKFAGLPAPKPCMVLLDLNMPRMDGREALRVIKADPGLRNIPVVVLSTSRAPEDVEGSYDAGANSYIIKPATFDGLVQMIGSLKEYWLEMVELPPNNGTSLRA